MRLRVKREVIESVIVTIPDEGSGDDDTRVELALGLGEERIGDGEGYERERWVVEEVDDEGEVVRVLETEGWSS